MVIPLFLRSLFRYLPEKTTTPEEGKKTGEP